MDEQLTLIQQIDERQEQLLQGLDRLNAEIEAIIELYTKTSPTAEPSTTDGVAA